jgi:hypothetical protein
VSAAPLAPDIRTPISPIDFGTVTVGSSLNKTTTIFNDGNATLTINSIARASGSSEFAYIGPSTPFSVGAGGSQAVTVRFSSTSVGSKSATFTVSSNDPDEASVTFSVLGIGAGTSINDQQKQQEILNMVNNHNGSLSAELVLAIICQEGGSGAFYVDGWNYNSFYRESDGPWAQPTNGDGIMQVTTASGYHERSGAYTHDRDGYDHVINDGCHYLLEHYSTYGSYVQATLHYNSGPNTLYIYLGKNWGDRNYLSHVANHLNTFVPTMYGLQNHDLVDALNQGQAILNSYLYNKGIATGQPVDYYRPYQTQLDSDLHAIEHLSPELLNTTLSISPSSFTLQSDNSTTLTATLKDGSNNPLANKTVTWSKTAGSLSVTNGTTNSYGQVSVTYTAPTVTAQTSVTITASFTGDNSYQASSGYSYGTITVENIAALTPTSLTISPSSFTLSSGQSTTLTATLRDNANNPLANKTIAWSATAGTVSPSSGATNQLGQISVTYTAPNYEITDNITATFSGDTQYRTSSRNSSGQIIDIASTILAITPSSLSLQPGDITTFTATLTSGGSPVAGKTVSWIANAGSLSPSSGTTNSSGQVTITYTAPSVTSQTSVTVTASFAGDASYQASSGSSTGTVSPTALPTLQIQSEYSGFFLHNVNAITNTYRAVLSSEAGVSRVVFQMGGETRTDTSLPYEAAFNMGGVGLSPTLNVTVYMADARTVSGSLSPTILATPASLSRMLNGFYALGQATVSKKANGCWKLTVNGIVQVLAAGMNVSSSPVPFNVGAGNYELAFSSWVLSFTIESDDYNKEINFRSFGLSIDVAKFMDNGGLSFDVELSGGFTVRPEGRNEISTPTLTISIGGSVSWTYEYPFLAGPVPITVYVSPHFDAALNIGFSVENLTASISVGGQIVGGVELGAGVGVPNVNAGGYFDGTMNLYFNAIPSFGFRKVSVEASVGLYVKFIVSTWKVELWSGNWFSNPGTNASSRSVGEWELNKRDYLGPGYSTFAWPKGEREGSLVENVFSNPQPSITVTENGDMVAAWTYDDSGKDLLRALEITYSTYDSRERAWSEPRMITSDNFLDFNPKLAYVGNARVLAVWQRVPRELGNVASPLDYAGYTELAYSILDLNTGVWSAPQLITSDNAYESPPILSSYGERAQLIYLMDSDNNPFTLNDQTLVATEWTGESWSSKKVIISGITVIGSPSLTLAKENEGVLTFIRDMDDNVLTTADREVFCIRYNGNWGAPARLTTDNLEDRLPSAGWANDRWYLSWIEAEPRENGLGYATSVRFAEFANDQLVGTSSLFENQGVTDQFLIGEIHDELYLLYQVGARGTPQLIRYDGNTWENVENFPWTLTVENARTSQLSVSARGNHLGVVGATDVQVGAGETSTSLHASTLSFYTITTNVEPSGGGSVAISPLAGPYVEGTQVTVTASAAPGYKFDHWSGDVSGTSETITLSMDSDKNIAANFVKIAETPWLLIGGIITAIVVGIIIYVLFYRRK